MGHLKRSELIGQEWQKRGGNATLFVKKTTNDTEAEAFFRHSKQKKRVQFVESFSELFASVLKEQKNNKRGFVLFDLNLTDNSILEQFASLRFKSLVLDPPDDSLLPSADILVDANRDEVKLKRGKQLLLYGCDYLILSPEIEEYKQTKTISPHPSRFLIGFGGYDTHKNAFSCFEKLLHSLRKGTDCTETRTILLKLPASSQKSEYEALFKRFGMQQRGDAHNKEERNSKRYLLQRGGCSYVIEVFKSKPSLLEDIAKADIFFTSAGISLYESLSLGTLPVVIPQNEAELIVAKRLYKRGFIPLKPHLRKMPEGVEKLLKDDRSLARKLINNAPCFDGKGLERLIEALKAL